MTYNEREYLCNRLVETAMTQEITQEQLAAIHKVIHTMQMKNCAGKETPKWTTIYFCNSKIGT